jgi:glycosyltransferase involved in cell wall biosynthesis
MTGTTKQIRVVHIARDFGLRFSGITHRLYSLLSGWRDEDVALDLWGTSVRPLNMGSGNPDYALAARLWPPGAKRSDGILGKLKWGVRQYAFLVTHARSYDVAHFYYLGSGSLLCPLLLHLLGKKAVFTSSLQGSDNPIAVQTSRWGRPAARLLRSFDGILAVSPLLAEEYRASGFKSVACIPNFLAVPQLEHGGDAAAGEKLRRALSIPRDAAVLLFVGAVIRRKGVDLLAESFARLASRHRDLWLIIVGPQTKADDGGIDEEFVRSVTEVMSGAGVMSRVVWVDMVRDRHVLARYYSAADIFVFPTRAEGLPNVLIEATAAGLPVVATNLPGCTDYVVKDGETGFLVPPEDVDALTQAVERLVSDTALRAKMGQAARAQSKRFGFEDYCRNLKAFYVKVAGLSR